MKFKTSEELLIFANESRGKPFSKIDLYDRLPSGKGSIGQVMEESYFGYEINSRHEADFAELGIELKVTPFVLTTKGYRAKERLVLGIINYCRENWDNFYESEFWMKNQKLLLMFYEHRTDIPKELWSIFDVILYEFPEEDLLIIERDWFIISNKVKSGLAHELSEGDTMYLGACTKGASAKKSIVNQPFSNIKAKQRAYSFKNSYMTYVINNYVFGTQSSEKIIKNISVLENGSFEEYVTSLFAPYLNKTQKELIALLNIKQSKATNYSIVKGILKVTGNLEETEEFQKANIIPKSIRIETNGKIKESMSFPAFKFTDFESLEWESSEFCEILSESRFLFIIFLKTDNNDENSIFKGIHFWSMPTSDVEEAASCWIKTKKIIKEGVQLTKTPSGIKNNLPKASENRVAHVRPHATKSAYRFERVVIGSLKNAYQLPDGRYMTKHCFWLNSSYISTIIRMFITR